MDDGNVVDEHRGTLFCHGAWSSDCWWSALEREPVATQ